MFGMYEQLHSGTLQRSEEIWFQGFPIHKSTSSNKKNHTMLQTSVHNTIYPSPKIVVTRFVNQNKVRKLC